jgi:hypothetical protein
MNNTGVFAGIEYFLARDMVMDNKKKVVIITGGRYWLNALPEKVIRWS